MSKRVGNSIGTLSGITSPNPMSIEIGILVLSRKAIIETLTPW